MPHDILLFVHNLLFNNLSFHAIRTSRGAMVISVTHVDGYQMASGWGNVEGKKGS